MSRRDTTEPNDSDILNLIKNDPKIEGLLCVIKVWASYIYARKFLKHNILDSFFYAFVKHNVW